VFLQPSIAALVVEWSITHVMADSINLHSEVRFRAVKIEYARADWMLTAKDWLPRQPRAESFPKPGFRY
jgi:hypothetical protein